MIKALNRYLMTAGGQAPVSVRLAQAKYEQPVTLQAVDETGIVMAADDGTGPLMAIPWHAIERVTWTPQ